MFQSPSCHQLVFEWSIVAEICLEMTRIWLSYSQGSQVAKTPFSELPTPHATPPPPANPTQPYSPHHVQHTLDTHAALISLPSSLLRYTLIRCVTHSIVARSLSRWLGWILGDCTWFAWVRETPGTSGRLGMSVFLRQTTKYNGTMVLLTSWVCWGYLSTLPLHVGYDTFYFRLLSPQKHAAYATFSSEKSAAKVIFVFHRLSSQYVSIRRLSHVQPVGGHLVSALTSPSLPGPEPAPPAADPQSHTCCGVCQGPRPDHCVKRPTSIGKVGIVH